MTAPEQRVAVVETDLAATQKVAVSGHNVPEEVADRESEQGTPAAPAPSLAREWTQIVENGDPMLIWAFTLRNPEAPEAELARSWLILFIDATEDVPLLNTLRAANGVVAERAQRRLNDLSAVATIKDQAPAVVAASDDEAKIPTHSPDAARSLESGLLRLHKADFDGAIAAFDAALGLEPWNALAHSHRGSAWGRKGDQDRALADFELALRIDPGNPVIHRSRDLQAAQRCARSCPRGFRSGNQAGVLRSQSLQRARLGLVRKGSLRTGHCRLYAGDQDRPDPDGCLHQSWQGSA